MTLGAQSAASLVKFEEVRLGPDGEEYVYEGMRDLSGRLIIPPDYDYIWDFGTDTFTLARKLVWMPDVKMMGIVYQIVTSGGYLNYEFPSYLVPEPRSEGLFRTFNERTLLYGFVDLEGNVAVKFRYLWADDFSEGLAAFEDPKSGLMGYINKKGKVEIPAKFQEAYPFSDGKAVVKADSKYSYLTKSQQLIPIEGIYSAVQELKGGVSVVIGGTRDSLLYGIVDKNGKVIVAPRYDFIDNFETGTAVFVSGGRAGMLDSQGKIIVEPRYDELFRFDQLHYLFQQNGLKGLVRTDGRIILPARYSFIDFFSEGLSAILRSGKWGFADTSGTEIIPCQFSEVGSGFNAGVAEVKLGDKWWIAHRGDTLQLPDYDEVLPFYGQSAAFRKDGLWGFLNLQGEEITEAQFEELVFNKGGIYFARAQGRDSVWYVISNKGILLSQSPYKDVSRFSEGFAAVKKESGWGFIDKSGKEISSFNYDVVRNFSEGYAAVNKKGAWGLIDHTGKEIIPPYLESNASATEQQKDSPLYARTVIGDVQNSCLCVELSDASRACLDVRNFELKGECDYFEKSSDIFEEVVESNHAYNIIRLPGRWLRIDKTGMIVN